jgi:hypothetical protein
VRPGSSLESDSRQTDYESGTGTSQPGRRTVRSPNRAVQRFAVLAALVTTASLGIPPANAACQCVCMNGEVEAVCSSSIDVQPICPPRVCPIVPPAVRPIDPPRFRPSVPRPAAPSRSGTASGTSGSRFAASDRARSRNQTRGETHANGIRDYPVPADSVSDYLPIPAQTLKVAAHSSREKER